MKILPKQEIEVQIALGTIESSEDLT